MGSPDSNGTLATKIRTNEAYSGHIKVTYVTETVVKGIPDKYVGDCRINVGVVKSEGGVFPSFSDIATKLTAILTFDEELLDKVMDNETTRLVVYGTQRHDVLDVNFTCTFRSDFNNEYSAKVKSFVTFVDIASLSDIAPSFATRIVVNALENGYIGVDMTKERLLADANYTFGISDEITESIPTYQQGLLGMLSWDSGGQSVIDFNGKVLLADWIKYSQKREDFTVPEPLNPRDLVDKKYVDGKISVGADGTIEIKVGEDTYIVQATKKTTTS